MSPERQYKPRTETQDKPADREIFEALLNVPGSVGDTYSRFHPYSLRNIGLLALQGCPAEPVGTFRKWHELGGSIKSGSKAYTILRPISIRKKDEDDEPTGETFTRFKMVKALFPLSMTTGVELPPYEPPHWSKTRALGKLGIKEVPFENYDGNIGGYASGRTIAINPVAPYPLRTTMHELSHIMAGHTSPENLKKYQEHRGTFEFVAEASAYISLKEIDELDELVGNVMRGYIQGWTRNEKPTEASFSQALNASTQIVTSGYEDKTHKAGEPAEEAGDE